ncbi:MAG: hypothetical protein NZ602_11485 [Thermoguttaceae bacterium]|nr:hypothetical protein [Thermoguttaceae bacterium]MDW8039310.1 hypothetical protein [Thermoguttaceae bacterium]
MAGRAAKETSLPEPASALAPALDPCLCRDDKSGLLCFGRPPSPGITESNATLWVRWGEGFSGFPLVRE